VLKTGSPVHAPKVIHAIGIGSNWLVPNAKPSFHACPRRINDSRAKFTTAKNRSSVGASYNAFAASQKSSSVGALCIFFRLLLHGVSHID